MKMFNMSSVMDNALVPVTLLLAVLVPVVLFVLSGQLRKRAHKQPASSGTLPSGKGSFVYANRLPTDPAVKNRGMCVLVIDPQNDFCDPSGSLYVKGAEEDMTRFASAFEKLGLGKVGDVFVTLDTHERYHIAHAMFWVSDKGEHPKPFTSILAKEVKAGKWKATRSEHQKWAEEYVNTLETKGRFTLVIWPDHCLVGTNGHAVYPPLQNVFAKWEAKNNKSVNYVLKGNNAFTEHYSGLKAEVERPDDPSTKFNNDLVAALSFYDRIVIAGEAKSHCVNFTARDLVAALPEKQRGKIWLCKDAMSNVTGFDKAGDDFFNEMKAKGIRLVKSTEAFM